MDFLFQVEASSNTTHLKCLCNHLTSFGGNFIQAPNPIDFDKVFTEFTRLGETGNVSVLVTIACAFLLYFVILIFARRADKKDENKVQRVLDGIYIAHIHIDILDVFVAPCSVWKKTLRSFERTGVFVMIRRKKRKYIDFAFKLTNFKYLYRRSQIFYSCIEMLLRV